MAEEPQSLDKENKLRVFSLSRAQIQDRLRQLEQEQNVKVLFAAEAGSRCWGIESPDSDYDIRFVFCRPLEDYVRLEPKPDAINPKPDELWDLAGWDIAKTLKLLKKNNISLLEWIQSPTIYVPNKEFVEDILSLVRRFGNFRRLAWSYQCYAFSNYRNDFKGKEFPPLKKYFYVLRPLFASMAIEKGGFKDLPPILFEDAAKLILPEGSDLAKETARLLDLKRRRAEKEPGEFFPALTDFIVEKMESMQFVDGGSNDFDESEYDRIFRKYIDFKTS